MPLRLIAPPAAEPLSLADAKDHLRIDADNTAFDAMIPAWIKAARESAEHILQRALVTQDWELVLDAFPCGPIALAYPPVQQVISVKYLDTLGVEQTLAPAAYALDFENEPGWVHPALGTSWPATLATVNALRVQFRCGFGGAAAVPASIVDWIKLHVGISKRNAEGFAQGVSVAELPGRHWDSLLDRHRFYGNG
jgi:uncharacterized phiE125 gp8 family phage protein